MMPRLFILLLAFLFGPLGVQEPQDWKYETGG
jgi:hypothetical protein